MGTEGFGQEAHHAELPPKKGTSVVSPGERAAEKPPCNVRIRLPYIFVAKLVECAYDRDGDPSSVSPNPQVHVSSPGTLAWYRLPWCAVATWSH